MGGSVAPASLAELSGWVVQAGLAGKSEPLMLAEFCRRANAAGLSLARSAVLIDTLHPVHEGRAFRWRREDDGDAELIEYGPTTDGEAAETWRTSPFYRLLETGEPLLRRKLSPSES